MPARAQSPQYLFRVCFCCGKKPYASRLTTGQGPPLGLSQSLVALAFPS